MADVNRFIDYVNEIMHKENIPKSRVAKAIGVDKNSLGNYLLKHTGMPMHVGIKLAEYLHIDISKVCGIETEATLSKSEKEMIHEIRKIPKNKRETAITRLSELIKIFNL